MLKGVIFDMDGVIVDSHPIHLRAWKRFFSSVGRSITDSELDFVLDGRTREDILRHFFVDLPCEGIAAAGKWKDELFYQEAAKLQPISGLLPFLDALEAAGIAKVVATSGGRERAEFILTKLDIKHRFSAVVTGDAVAVGKPDPAIFQLAGERLGMHRSEILVAEDARSGVKGAKAAGMKCLAVASHGRQQLLLDAGADFVVTTFSSDLLVHLQFLFSPQGRTQSKSASAGSRCATT